MEGGGRGGECQVEGGEGLRGEGEGLQGEEGRPSEHAGHATYISG